MKIVRVIFTLAVLAVATMVVINRGNVESLIPAEYNPVELILSIGGGDAQTEIVVVEPQAADSIDMVQVDSLQRDSLEIKE